MPVTTIEDQEQEQAYASELVQAMAAEQAEQQAQQLAAAQQQRLIQQQAMMQQMAATAAQQGEGGFSDKEYRQMTKQMTKQYKIKIESLKKDLDMEWKAFGSPFYFPIMTMLLSISAIIDVINLGTVWTIVNWIIFVCMPIIRVQRAWTKATIMYSSAERQVKRRAVIYQRQIWNTTKRTLASVVEAVPILNIIPVWPALTALDKMNERKHQHQLRQLREKVRVAEQRINRLVVRAKSGKAQYQIALFAMHVAKSIDDEFLKV